MRNSTRHPRWTQSKRRGRFVLWTGVLVVCGCVEGVAAAEPRAPIDLQGSWYVLVSYRDSTTAAPAEQRWEDKVWTFEAKGSRLLWTEYPVVVFADERGRFEKLASGRVIKSSGAWQPNPAQLAQVESGLSVNSQWARGKSLKGDPQRGYRSGGRANRESASVIGYSEAWEIQDLATLPVFRRSDEMSSGRSVALAGRTEYRSEAVAAAEHPGRITGAFSRDRVQTGSFLMIRSGPVEFASPKGKKLRGHGHGHGHGKDDVKWK